MSKLQTWICVAEVTVAVACLLYMYYKSTYLPRLKERRLVGDDDELMRRIDDGTEALFILFGKDVSTVSTRTAVGRIIDIKCRKCGKRNRLIKGFRNASCGSCRISLTIPQSEGVKVN